MSAQDKMSPPHISDMPQQPMAGVPGSQNAAIAQNYRDQCQ